MTTFEDVARARQEFKELLTFDSRFRRPSHRPMRKARPVARVAALAVAALALFGWGWLLWSLQ